MGGLERGKWKIPLYNPPTDYYISKDQIPWKPFMKKNWFYLRLAFPYDD